MASLSQDWYEQYVSTVKVYVYTLWSMKTEEVYPLISTPPHVSSRARTNVDVNHKYM